MAERDIPDTDDDDIPLEGHANGHANGHAHSEPLETAGNGIANTALSPINRGEIHHEKTAQSAVEYEIVETDDNGRPLNARPDERLTAQGDETYLERQQTQRQRAEDANLSRGQRRRQQQKSARQFNEQENQQLRSELAELKQRMDGIQPHLQRFDATQRQEQQRRIDDEIAAAGRSLAEAQRRQTEAVQKLALGESGAAEEFNRASTDALQAAVRGERATMAKAQFERQVQATGGEAGAGRQRQSEQHATAQPSQAQQPQAIQWSQRGRQMATDFQQRNDWIDPHGRDTISKAALAIDEAVLHEGFNPNTQEYWDELEDRLAEAFPHKFVQQDGQAQRQPAQRANGNAPRQAQGAPQRRGPMTGAGEGAGTRRQKVAVTPGRKEALLQAGVIDNTGRVTNKTKFDRIMRQFSEFDAQQVATQ